MSAPAPEPTESDRRAGRRRAVWRWHFFAGLFVAPVVLVLSITGGLYLFQKEITRWWNADLVIIQPGATPMTLQSQESLVLTAFPGATIHQVGMPLRADEASVWSLETRDGAARDVYVDPYRGHVVGDRDSTTQPMSIVAKLHGTLLAGQAGSYLVELVACWTLIMLVTGIYLWWPERWKWRGVAVPRLDEGVRTRRRDLHAIPAMLVSLVVGFLVITGLPWSAFWGVQFAKLGAVMPWVAPSPNFSAPPALAGRVEDPHAVHREKESLPWPVQQMETPSALGAGDAGVALVDRRLAALDLSYGPGVRVFYPESDTGVYTVSYVPMKAQGQRTLYLDPSNGGVLADIGWRDYSPAAKAVEWGVMAHMGKQLGRGNQIFNLVIVLTLIAAAVLGIYMWWERRPPGTLGAPALRPGDSLPPAMAIALVTIGVLFPFAGATMLLVLFLGQVLRTLRNAG